MSKKVLLVGLQSSSVNFDDWPGLTKEDLEKAAVRIRSELQEAGFTIRFCLTDDGATARETFRQAVDDFEPDVISIGAGVRANPKLLGLFEDLVNVAHERAPQAAFAFNTNPMNAIESVKRAAQRR